MSDQEPISRRGMLRIKFLGRLISNAADDIKADSRESTPPSPALGNMIRYPVKGSDLPQLSQTQSSFRRRIPVLRPPGAVNEDIFLTGCTRCNACLEACPHDAIIHAPKQFREAAGTPMINPVVQPCLMCEDFPCVSVCEPGVLTDLIPPVMGTARITAETCLAHQGSFCTVCSEHCPVDDAIQIDNCKPTINEDACTGCGVCQHVCPAPENAVLIMPTLTRPVAPTPADPTQEANTDE